MNMDSLSKLSMDGKIAVVTGSTQGLGEAIAHLFADRGCKGIVITGRNEKNGARVKADLEKKGVKALFVKADLSSMDDTRKVIAATDKHFGRVDALVNAAGITDRGTIWDTKPELFDPMMASMCARPFSSCRTRCSDEARKDQGHHRQHHLHVGPWRAELHLGLLHFQGRAHHAHQEHRLFSDAAQIRVNGLTIGWMDTPGEDRIMKTYHNAEEGWLEKAEAGGPSAAC